MNLTPAAVIAPIAQGLFDAILDYASTKPEYGLGANENETNELDNANHIVMTITDGDGNVRQEVRNQNGQPILSSSRDLITSNAETETGNTQLTSDVALDQRDQVQQAINDFKSGE